MSRKFEPRSGIAACLLVLANAHAAETHEDETRWIDINGCRFLNPRPDDPPPQTKMNWTGQCHEGTLSGKGELTFEIAGMPPTKYVGDFTDGRIVHGRLEANGNVFEGEFQNNRPGGMGSMTYANGIRIKGRFVASSVGPEGSYEVEFPNGNRYVGTLDAQLRMHGNGTFQYADGSIYEGELREGLSEGRGTMRRANGNVESGTYAKGQLHGAGTMTWATGVVYEGGFVAGSPHGQGVMRFPDGTKYTGGFVSGKYGGKGRIEYAVGGWCEAEFVLGQLHGQGKCSYANGSRYEGAFLADQMTGDGVLTSATGEVREGRFLNGKLTGRCVISMPSGYRFEGQCVDDMAEGTGHVEDPQAKVVYDGGFRRNLPHGEGTMTRGPSTYKGTFKDGKRDGRGAETVRDGDAEITYEGEFSNDLWHGRGALRMQDKDAPSITYEGQFARGSMEGPGALSAGSTTVRGEFKANVLVKGTVQTQEGRTFEIDATIPCIKEVMKDGSKRDLDALPSDLSIGV